MRILAFIISQLFILPILGQGWIQEGAHLQNDSAFLVIEGPNANFSSTGNASINMQGKAEIRLQGDWNNNSNNQLFTGNAGLVQFYGFTQNIQGSRTTFFPSLETTGTGDKTLQINTLVGGGFGRGTGELLLSNGRVLNLNSNRLIINNPSPNAIPIFVGMGYIQGETGSIPGYGVVQWNIRDAIASSNYQIPLGTNLYFRWFVNGLGTQLNDSGFVTIATYPTNAVASPNNLPFATGVTNTNNEYGIENSLSMTDRFWILGAEGYTIQPDLNLYFKHFQNNGGNNLINEPDLGAIRWDIGTNKWLYPVGGTSNVAGEFVLLNAGRNFDGIWTLSDTTPCPITDFLADDACEDDSTFFSNLSTTQKGNLDQYRWDFKNSNTANTFDAAELFTPTGVYPVELFVRNSYGCWDSIEKNIVVNPRAIADFIFNPSSPKMLENVIFTNNSQKDDSWEWNFGDGSISTNENPSYIYSEAGDFEVQLVANNQFNCPDTIVKTVNVSLLPIFWVPSAFSPGGKDDLNKEFGLSTLVSVSEYSLEIYNHWGEKIFESNDPANRWDGTYLGNEVPMGAYIYLMFFREESLKMHSYHGEIQVIR